VPEYPLRPTRSRPRKKYPGVAVWPRAVKKHPGGDVLRIYHSWVPRHAALSQPAFAQTAPREWNAKRLRQRSQLLLSKELVRTYRVGMSCGFCSYRTEPGKAAGRPGGSAVGEISAAPSARQ